MSPAGVRDRLDVTIRNKCFHAASGGKLEVLGELAFSLAPGEVAALVGPSGCGKTTLLRIIAGTRPRVRRQRDAAGPWHAGHGVPGAATAALAQRGAECPAGRAEVPPTAGLDALFHTLGLAAHRNYYPGELSLGLARRVALARAFAVEPDLLLLDEPFVSLDDALAARLRDELAELVNRRPVTTLLVTHRRGSDRARRPAAAVVRQPCPRAGRGAGRASARRPDPGRAARPARRDRAADQPFGLMLRACKSFKASS